MASAVARTALGSSEPESLSKQPAIAPDLPFTTRIYCGFRIWAFKFLVWTFLNFLRLYHRSPFSSLGPNRKKHYDVRPSLQNRIYLPKSYDEKSGTKLPLYLNVHGGGFAICDPSVDDHFCRPLADKYGFLVVSLNYRKAPLHPFPNPVHDVAALIRAVLDDTTLPIDYSKVVLGGFSAGGNLTLAAAQFPDIRARVKALVPVYPVVDFSNRYKGTYRNTKDGRRDILEKSSTWFNWAYLPPGTDRTNPLLSPIYASRQDFPNKIFFIGAEYDYLCHEAEIMAKKLAGYDKDARTGPKWEKNGIMWKMYWDMQHGFTHAPQSGEYEEERKQVTEECYRDIAQWIHKDVFGGDDLIDL